MRTMSKVFAVLALFGVVAAVAPTFFPETGSVCVAAPLWKCKKGCGKTSQSDPKFMDKLPCEKGGYHEWVKVHD